MVEFFDRQGEGYHFTRLAYIPDAEYHFDFHPSPQWVVEYAPGEETATHSEVVGNWDSALVRVDRWLDYLRREIGVGDPWAELTEAAESFQLGTGPDDTDHFTDTQQAQIVERIEQVKNLLLDSGALADADRHIIIERLDYLRDAVRRLSRFDWRNVAVGVVIDLGIRGFMDTGTAKQVLDFLVGSAQRLLT